MTSVRELAERAKIASRPLAALSRAHKDAALQGIADALRRRVDEIGVANAQDLDRARESELSAPMISRLDMGIKQVDATAAGVEFIMGLQDPVGSRGPMQRLGNGLLVGQQRLPLGVIGMIYESRPNVTVDAAALCLKAGNSVVLRGGKEAAHTNALLGQIIGDALHAEGLPRDAVQIVPPHDREGTKEMITLTGLIDLIIPRGGEGLIRYVSENARIPVVAHYKGVCHLYLDTGCAHAMAVDLALNSKAQKPGVCNALECLLVHEDEAAELLPKLADALQGAGVELRGCEKTRSVLPKVKAATNEDWGEEFLAMVLAVKVVSDIDGAMAHIVEFGSNHTEVICTESQSRAQRWLREVDASAVMVNASTRFNDGGELGLGAEMGISTSKTHVYGPMGLLGLTSEKWVVLGDGQVRK